MFFFVQNVQNVHETFINTQIPFQKLQVSSETSLPWMVQNKPSASIRCEENKVEFLERQFHSEKLSFVHQKESEHSFKLSLSICLLSAFFQS